MLIKALLCTVAVFISSESFAAAKCRLVFNNSTAESRAVRRPVTRVKDSDTRSVLEAIAEGAGETSLLYTTNGDDARMTRPGTVDRFEGNIRRGWKESKLNVVLDLFNVEDRKLSTFGRPIWKRAGDAVLFAGDDGQEISLRRVGFENANPILRYENYEGMANWGGRAGVIVVQVTEENVARTGQRADWRITGRAKINLIRGPKTEPSGTRVEY